MNTPITLVTGNPNKLKEIQQITPSHIKLVSQAVDLPEIQSLSLRAIAEDKIKKAYEIVKAPVIIEDVSAGLDALHGLPGPFYKFFRDELGDKVLIGFARMATDSAITVTCTAAYYDGKNLIFAEGILHGAVTEARGTNGFGFDPYIVPDGESRTVAEMSIQEKHAISHRGKAFKSLFEQISRL